MNLIDFLNGREDMAVMRGKDLRFTPFGPLEPVSRP